MTTYFRYSSILLFVVILAQTSVPAQEKDDISWLGHIPRPVVSLDVMKGSWEQDSSRCVFTDVVVDWVQGKDDEYKKHSIRKAFNCMPMGRFSDANGDSVSADPSSARIELIMDGGAIFVYKVTIPMITDAGKPAVGPISGGLNLVFGASKIIDRKYTQEHTLSKFVQLPL